MGYFGQALRVHPWGGFVATPAEIENTSKLFAKIGSIKFNTPLHSL